MKTFKIIALVGTIAIFFVTGAAFAQGMGGRGGAGAGCQDRFDALDTNHDGKVTKEEFTTAPHYRNNPEQMFKSMDVNGQGYLTRDNFCSGKGMGMGKGMGPGKGRGMNQ